MAKRVTVYLTGKIAPGGQDWHQGEEIRRDAMGITLAGTAHAPGATFYPWTSVERVEAR